MKAIIDPVVHLKEAADIVGLSKEWLRRLAHGGRGPAITRVGRKICFRRADLESWLEHQRETPPAA